MPALLPSPGDAPHARGRCPPAPWSDDFPLAVALSLAVEVEAAEQTAALRFRAALTPATAVRPRPREPVPASRPRAPAGSPPIRGPARRGRQTSSRAAPSAFFLSLRPRGLRAGSSTCARRGPSARPHGHTLMVPRARLSRPRSGQLAVNRMAQELGVLDASGAARCFLKAARSPPRVWKDGVPRATPARVSRGPWRSPPAAVSLPAGSGSRSRSLRGRPTLRPGLRVFLAGTLRPGRPRAGRRLGPHVRVPCPRVRALAAANPGAGAPSAGRSRRRRLPRSPGHLLPGPPHPAALPEATVLSLNSDRKGGKSENHQARPGRMQK